jgi:hypothetical protein
MPEMDCQSCGVSLMAEAFAGPPRIWWATEGVLSVIAARHGWAEGVCPECQEDRDVR